MGLEAATFIHQLNPAWPIGGVDPKAQGDDNLRMIKSALQATFPNIAGAMTVTHAVLNQWGGLTAAYAWTGQHSWTQPLLGPAGSLGAPSYSFSADPDTGIWLGAANTISFVTNGIHKMNIGPLAILPGVVTLTIDGTAANPAYSFNNDPNTGIYSFGADELGVAVGGTNTVRLHSTYTFSLVPVIGPLGSAAAPTYTFTTDLDTGIYRAGANNLGFSTAGVSAGLIDEIGNFRWRDGTNALPAYSFSGDSDTGIFRSGSGEMRFTCDGTTRFILSASYFQSVSTQMANVDGSAGTPAYGFTADPDTGIYRSGANALNFSEGGAGYRVGYRTVPRSTTVTTLDISDIGKCVAVSAAINIPASVFAAGDCISIYNDSAASVNITISAGTLRLAGTTTTGTRTLAPRGMATLWFNVGGAAPEVIASGAGVG